MYLEQNLLFTVPTWILHLTLKPCQKIKNHKLPEVNLQREREETNHIGKLEECRENNYSSEEEQQPSPVLTERELQQV